MNISETVTVTDRPPYLADASHLHQVRAGFFPADNASVKNSSGTTTSYGLVYAGTVLAKDTDDNVHPCGLCELTAVSSGGDAIVTVGATNQAAYRIGDEVAVFAEDTVKSFSIVGEADTEVLRTSVPHGMVVGDHFTLSGLTGGTGVSAGDFRVKALSTEGPATIAVTGEADDETFTTVASAPHNLAVGDVIQLNITAGGTGATSGKKTVATVPSATTFTLTDVAFTADITAGTITTPDRTLTDFTFEDEAGTQATFSTDITAGTLTFGEPGQPTYRNLTGTRYITAINTSTGAITVSGSNVTAAIGDLLIKLKAYRPCGILDRNINTLQPMIDGSTVKMGETVPIRHEGGVRKSKIIGQSAIVRRALSGAPWIDPVTGGFVEPYVGGFRFLNL